MERPDLTGDDDAWIERLLAGIDTTTELRFDGAERRDSGANLRHDSAETALPGMLSALRGIGDQVDDDPYGETVPFGLPERMDQVIADAAAAAEFDAAAAYLLDEDTTGLKTVSVYGLNPSRLLNPMRDLADARADLECLITGVVAIDDLKDSIAPTWNAPEDGFGAAICVSIMDGDYPLGTLWLFSRQTMAITPSETAAARLAAGSLASLLQDESRRDAAVASNRGESPTIKVFPGTETPAASPAETRAPVDAPAEKAQPSTAKPDPKPLARLSAWQYHSLPAGTRIAEDWFVDGMIESSRDWAIGWHHWDILPDGTLALLMAEATDASLAGAMTATFARSAAISHLGYRHNAGELLSRVNDTMWQMNVDGQTLSLMYARLDVESGVGDIATAGAFQSIVASRHGHRPLSIADDRRMGLDFEADFQTTEFQLQQGEVLLGLNAAVLRAADADQVGRVVRDGMKSSAVSPLGNIRKHIKTNPLTDERGAIALVRR